MTRGWVLGGGGGHARSVADVLTRLDERVAAVIDPQPEEAWSVPVHPDVASARASLLQGPALVCLGSNDLRARVQREFEAGGFTCGVVVARTATVAVPLGAGTAVLEHAHVGPGTSVGRGVIINTGAVVEHGARIGDFVHVGPGALVLGGASVGAGTLIGAGAIVLPGVEVGEGVVLGAGSVAVADVAPGVVLVGAPGRPLVR